MGRGISLLDVSPPIPAFAYHNSSRPSPLSSSSSSSLTMMIIVLSSALILSICLYLLLRCLSSRPSSTPAAAARQNRPLHTSLDSTPSLPLFKFSSLAPSNIETADCAICLASFEPRDQLRLLPLCCHAFHAHCIDKWLSSSHDTCPLCRSPVYSTEADVINKTLSRENSYRIEIGSLSTRRFSDPGEGLQRSYSIGPLEYVVGDRYEVSVGLCCDKESISDAPESFGGGDMAGQSWLMDYVDRLGSFSSRTFSRRSSGRFWNGSVRRSEGVVTVEDLEANRIGEEISEIFRWLSGI